MTEQETEARWTLRMDEFGTDWFVKGPPIPVGERVEVVPAALLDEARRENERLLAQERARERGIPSEPVEAAAQVLIAPLFVCNKCGFCGTTAAHANCPYLAVEAKASR